MRTFPARVARLLGEPLGLEESGRLIEARLAFLLTRALLNQVLLAHGFAESRRRLAPIGVHGADHLEAALGEKRGVIVISAHFGLPPLIRLVLEDLGARVIGVGGAPSTESTSRWAVTRGIARAAFNACGMSSAKRVCVLLADSSRGRYTERPSWEGGSQWRSEPSASLRSRAVRC